MKEVEGGGGAASRAGREVQVSGGGGCVFAHFNHGGLAILNNRRKNAGAALLRDSGSDCVVFGGTRGVAVQGRYRPQAALVAERLEWLDGPCVRPKDNPSTLPRSRHLVDKLRNPEDRRILEMYYLKGYSYRRIGRETGMNPKRVRHRVRKLTMGLMRGEYPICLQNRGPLSWFHQELARERYVLGMSRGAIARCHHRSQAEIDTHLRYMEMWFRTIRDEPLHCQLGY